MPPHFDLIITADYPSRTAEFFLRDSAGVQLAWRQTKFEAISVSHQQGLFDLRNYLRLYVEEGKERAAVAEIGVCIAEEVLGEEIFAKLWASESQRTLRIQLPGAADTENHLAAALARVPWEIATPKAGAETLGDPMSPLRWTLKSTRRLAAELTHREHPVSARKVAALLKAAD